MSIISKLNRLDLSDDDIAGLFYFERYKILNDNLVLLPRHFQYRVGEFFKEIVSDDLLGKVKYYVIQVELTFLSIPHIHSFLRVVNAPVLTKDTKKQYKLLINLSKRIWQMRLNSQNFMH